jgi:hypothetical protein
MKNIFNSGLIILLLISGTYIVFLRECKSSNDPAKDEIIIKRSVMDSIRAIANKPSIIKIDTIKIIGKTVYIYAKSLPKPIPNTDSTINIYKDSLINPEIRVWLNDKIKGGLIDRKWEYKPIVKQIMVDKTVFVPKIVDNFVSVPKNGIFIYGMAGGNKNMFLPGVGIDLITKKNTVIGGIYQRYGSDNVFSVKLGIKLWQ